VLPTDAEAKESSAGDVGSGEVAAETATKKKKRKKKKKKKGEEDGSRSLQCTTKLPPLLCSCHRGWPYTLA
jgi:hypothetical protein